MRGKPTEVRVETLEIHHSGVNTYITWLDLWKYLCRHLLTTDCVSMVLWSRHYSWAKGVKSTRKHTSPLACSIAAINEFSFFVNTVCCHRLSKK